jgi:hypothetical protein
MKIKVLVGKPAGRRPDKHRCRWEDNIKNIVQ